MTTDAERRKQRELDSILDAALDDLDDDDSDSDDAGDRARRDGAERIHDRAGTAGRRQSYDDDAPTGVPYSLEYLANNRRREDAESRSNTRRPRFGPDPPPLASSSSSLPPTLDVPPRLPPMPPLDLPPGDAEELAASLEGMMKQFAEGMGLDGDDLGGMEGVGDSALDDVFRKMMAGDAMETIPSAGNTQSQRDRRRSDKKGDASAASSDDISGKSTPRTDNKYNNPAPREGNRTENNARNNAKEPNVDESINRLLDGINQAANAPLPNMNAPNPGVPDDVDPAQFQKMGEEMMENIMGQFEKMGKTDDGNDVVDGVMKQLLDKDLMYEPMREVCLRFPKWLAANKEELTEDEYERYGKQYQYFQKIVRVYETEPDNFERLMELMQDIQEYGQPPADIIKQLAPELEFDAEGMPVMNPGGAGMPGMPPGMVPGMMPTGMGGEQCCIS